MEELVHNIVPSQWCTYLRHIGIQLLQWEKLQKHSEEVRERAETAECQIAAISQEYRKLLQERDVSVIPSNLCTLNSV